MTAGEFGRLSRLAPLLAGDGDWIPVGVGDDAAVVVIGGAAVVVCVDALVEGVHFRRNLSSPADVGWKAMAVNVSDVAAMGGTARAAVVALNRPTSVTEADVDDLYRGMADAAAAWGVAIVGGDTCAAEEWSVAVTVLGDLGTPRAGATGPDSGPGPIRRSGAVAGDAVLLAGSIGAAAAALEADRRGAAPDPAHLAAHRRPRALPATGRALAHAGATAMIDVSDGLGADARHLCEASGVGMQLDLPALRTCVAAGVREAVGQGWVDLAIAGGEDFALLATVPRDRVDEAVAAVAAAGEVAAVPIGVVVADPVPAVWLHGDDHPRRIDHLGYDHG